MFLAWLITIGIFLVCIYATFTIVNGLKEKDQKDLEILQSQYKNLTIQNKGTKKQIA
ncbi:MAG: hypothetical protein AB2392_15035 [Neobacillus sp.]|jgi:hypothetical protein